MLFRPEVAYLRKETVKGLLKLAESSREPQCLKYAITKAAGMSSSQAKVTYGFNDMSSKISVVENALEDAAAIRDAIENIAKVEDLAILHSLGIYDTTVENESDKSDGSETDSDTPDDDEGILCGVNGGSVAANKDEAQVMRFEQFGRNVCAEETETSMMDDDQLIDILRCCDLNWIEFVRLFVL